MPTVTLQPSGRTVLARPGASLLAIVHGAGLPIAFSCRGRGICVACRLRVEGDVEPPGAAEAALLARIGPENPGPWRIACLCRVVGDTEVRADYW